MQLFSFNLRLVIYFVAWFLGHARSLKREGGGRHDPRHDSLSSPRDLLSYPLDNWARFGLGKQADNFEYCYSHQFKMLIAYEYTILHLNLV